MASVRGIEMTGIQKKIRRLAKKYRLQIIYAFGSRAQEILAVTEGRRHDLSPSCSDLDKTVVFDYRIREQLVAHFMDLFFYRLFIFPFHLQLDKSTDANLRDFLESERMQRTLHRPPLRV